MRIIQSAWACNKSNLLTSNAGWLSPEYNLMSWALSSLQLKKYYPELILYSDSVSAKMLIDTLELPYNDVVCNLDSLNIYHPQLWALPKISAYSQQEKPFLHVDGDVFIWKKFEDSLLKGDLIAQNMESATDYYENIMVSLESSLNYFPDEIIKERNSKNPILAYNAGIFGGNNISFFKEYTEKALDFVGKNILNFSRINVSNFNIFFEQYLFYCLVKKHNKTVNVLLSETIGDNQYKGFDDFGKIPYEKHYLHLLGSYKRNDFVCMQMANRLRLDYPKYYYQIIELFKKNKLSLFKDYYSLENSNKEVLFRRYKNLVDEKIKIERESITSLRFDFNRDLKKELKGYNLSKSQFIDFEIFNSRIKKVVKKDFVLLSKDYLYARDCKASSYMQDLFKDAEAIYKKIIISDCDYKIVESKYNWSSFIEKLKVKKENEIVILEEAETNFHTLIIPECDQDRFSMAYVDSLDLVILDILKSKKTILELFNELKQYFETNDLNKNFTEFEELIFGRIRLGLYIKSLKLIKL